MNQGQYPGNTEYLQGNQQGYPQNYQQGYPQNNQQVFQQGYPQGNQQVYPQNNQQVFQQGYPQGNQQVYPQNNQQVFQQGYLQGNQQEYPQNNQQGYPQNYQQGYPQGSQQVYPQKKYSRKGLTIGLVVGGVVLVLVTCFAIWIISGIINMNKSDFSNSKFASNKWIERNDNSYLVPNSDGTFAYYKDKSDQTNYYYTGHYKLYIGQEGIDYVNDDLSEYGVTDSEIYELIRRNEQNKKVNFVCLVLENEECIIDGENTSSGTVTTPYYGFYKEDESGGMYLDLVNMNTALEYNFHVEY